MTETLLKFLRKIRQYSFFISALKFNILAQSLT